MKNHTILTDHVAKFGSRKKNILHNKIVVVNLCISNLKNLHYSHEPCKCMNKNKISSVQRCTEQSTNN